MGNTGTTGTKDHHVHYQLKDSTGRPINPTDFWDELGASKTDPGQPAYLREYLQYLDGLGANAHSGFGDVPGAATSPANQSLDAALNEPPPPFASENFRYLGRHIAGKPASSVFETGSPAVPYDPSNKVLSPDQKNSFGDRFGNWSALPAVPSNEGLTTDRRNSFDNRFGTWSSSPAGITPRNPNLPLQRPDPGTPRGMIDGSIPVGGLAGRIAALSGIDPDNPDQPVPPPGGLLKLLLGLTH